MLRDRGCRVVPFSPPDVPEALAIFYGLFGADGGAEWRKQPDGGAADPPRDTSARGFRPRPNQREAASPPTPRDRDPASVERDSRRVDVACAGSANLVQPSPVQH